MSHPTVLFADSALWQVVSAHMQATNNSVVKTYHKNSKICQMSATTFHNIWFKKSSLAAIPSPISLTPSKSEIPRDTHLRVFSHKLKTLS